MSDAWRTTHEPSRCSDFFSGEKCSIVVDLAVADDHVGVAGDDRRDELRDVRAVVLVVGVGVDDHVGAELQARVEARPGSRRRGPCCSSAGRCGRRRCARATSIVRSVEPSSMTSHSTASKPATSRGRSASVAGSVSSSLRQGIWMMQLHCDRRAAGARRRSAGSDHGTACAGGPARPRLQRSTARPSPFRLMETRDAHPAATGPARGSRPGRRPRCHGAWLALAGAHAWRHVGRLPRLPDVPELRLATTRCCGAARSLHGHAADLRRLPRADRAPARRSRFGALLALARRRRRPRHGRSRRSRRSSCSRPASTASGGSRFTPLVGVVAAAAAAARASTSRSSRRAATSTSRTSRSIVWAAALEAGAPAARHARVPAPRRRRA